MEKGEEGTIARQRARRTQPIDAKFAEHGGRIVKSTGDSLLGKFASAVDKYGARLESGSRWSNAKPTLLTIGASLVRSAPRSRMRSARQRIATYLVLRQDRLNGRAALADTPLTSVNSGTGSMTRAIERKTERAPKVEFVGVMHEGIPCKREDLDACIKFYTEVFGLRQLPRPKALDEFGPGAWLTDDEDRVQFHLIANDVDYSPGPGAKVTPAGRHTAWMVKDIEAFSARMESLGIQCSTIESLIGAPQVFVTDPAGHTWEFQGPPPK